MAVSGSLKLPPPPIFAKSDPAFNRWLLEVTAVLAAAGGIDPTQIQGWTELLATVAQNTSDITGLENNVLSLQNVTTTQGASITALQGRNQVYNGAGAPGAGLGIVGDWYGNLAGAAGARVYIKTGAATWTAFPF